jgi:hypothetical protein
LLLRTSTAQCDLPAGRSSRCRRSLLLVLAECERERARRERWPVDRRPFERTTHLNGLSGVLPVLNGDAHRLAAVEFLDLAADQLCADEQVADLVRIELTEARCATERRDEHVYERQQSCGGSADGVSNTYDRAPPASCSLWQRTTPSGRRSAARRSATVPNECRRRVDRRWALDDKDAAGAERARSTHIDRLTGDALRWTQSVQILTSMFDDRHGLSHLFDTAEFDLDDGDGRTLDVHVQQDVAPRVDHLDAHEPSVALACRTRFCCRQTIEWPYESRVPL